MDEILEFEQQVRSLQEENGLLKTQAIERERYIEKLEDRVRIQELAAN